MGSTGVTFCDYSTTHSLSSLTSVSFFLFSFFFWGRGVKDSNRKLRFGLGQHIADVKLTSRPKGGGRSVPGGSALEPSDGRCGRKGPDPAHSILGCTHFDLYFFLVGEVLLVCLFPCSFVMLGRSKEGGVSCLCYAFSKSRRCCLAWFLFVC